MTRTSRVGVCPSHARNAHRRPCREPPRTDACRRMRAAVSAIHAVAATTSASRHASCPPCRSSISLTLANNCHPLGPGDPGPVAYLTEAHSKTRLHNSEGGAALVFVRTVQAAGARPPMCANPPPPTSTPWINNLDKVPTSARDPFWARREMQWSETDLGSFTKPLIYISMLEPESPLLAHS